MLYSFILEMIAELEEKYKYETRLNNAGVNKAINDAGYESRVDLMKTDTTITFTHNSKPSKKRSQNNSSAVSSSTQLATSERESSRNKPTKSDIKEETK
jgi:hypothetical protein